MIEIHCIVLSCVQLIDIISSIALARIVHRKQSDLSWRPNYYWPTL